MQGQCNATTIAHVAMPLIFGLISDVAILLLPIAAIIKLQISWKKKLGLAAIFSVGVLWVDPCRHSQATGIRMLTRAVTARSACLLRLARIVELEVDTDDKSDPSCKCSLVQLGSWGTRSTDGDDLDGVVIFLILSGAEAVCAIVCASLPVVVTQLSREYKNIGLSRRSKYGSSTKHETLSQSRSTSRGFPRLVEGSGHRTDHAQNLPHEQTERPFNSIPLSTVVVETPALADDFNDAHVVVTKEVKVIREV